LPIVLWLVATIASERRTARLFALGAWTFAALAAMAKGPAGSRHPCRVGASLRLCAPSRGSRSYGSKYPCGIALSIAMIAPWYLALWARHGRAFLDELVMGNMIGRTLDHLHDTNEGENVGLTYFVGQLGYATFPWSGLLAGGRARLAEPRWSFAAERRARRCSPARRSSCSPSCRRCAPSFTITWLPAVPPLAMLLGIWLDERIAGIGQRRPQTALQRPRRSRSAQLASVALVGRDFLTSAPLSSPGGGARLMQLFTYRYTRTCRVSPHWGRSSAPSGARCDGRARVDRAPVAPLRRYRSRAVAVAFTVFVLDVYLVRAAPTAVSAVSSRRTTAAAARSPRPR